MSVTPREGSQASLEPIGDSCWRVTGALDFTTVTRLAAEGEALFDSLTGKGASGVRGFFSKVFGRDPAASPGLSRTEAELISLCIDLSAVQSANSAGLALLLEWAELASARGVQLTYRALPESLARIADFSNIRSLLPLDSASAR